MRRILLDTVMYKEQIRTHLPIPTVTSSFQKLPYVFVKLYVKIIPYLPLTDYTFPRSTNYYFRFGNPKDPYLPYIRQEPLPDSGYERIEYWISIDFREPVRVSQEEAQNILLTVYPKFQFFKITFGLLIPIVDPEEEKRIEEKLQQIRKDLRTSQRRDRVYEKYVSKGLRIPGPQNKKTVPPRRGR